MMSNLPLLVNDFLAYMETIRGTSKNTVAAYGYDLSIFFKFIKIRRNIVSADTDLEQINITDIDEYIIRTITLSDLYAFLSYTANTRDNKNHARARKVACLHSFFKYLKGKARVIDENPALDLEPPKINSRHPVYLTLDESKHLLSSISGDNKERDYAIITLFLNCGLRLSELVGIDMNRISDDLLTVIGKGNKERTVYLNNACLNAINEYQKVRPVDGVKDKNALFLSERKQRISKRSVQYIVKKYIGASDLDTDRYSTHKLRHTAATLMYKYGNVDIRALQHILGHENISTTQIYTHIDDDRLRNAVKANPLSGETENDNAKKD
ncbi:MAG TPA: tyrosine recombinase XerC [Patescibacteria group bacterium]|nr:tyrosine recombinase XerC [Patescibacteria group bacterium]